MVSENFDFTLHQVSNLAQEVIDRLYDHPNLEINYNHDIVTSQKKVYDFLVFFFFF